MSQRLRWLSYVATLAVGLGVIVLSVAALRTAATGLIQNGQSEKTVLDLQIESAREIRAALRKPIEIPPLPPITAHLAHEPRAGSGTGARLSVSDRTERMNAFAMQTPEPAEPVSMTNYPTLDRHAVR